MPKYAEEILAAVTELQQHPTAEQVFLEMKREHPSIALGTVYKHLKGFEQPQIVRTAQKRPLVGKASIRRRGGA